MNSVKTYIFDIDMHPFRLQIKATSILEAKKKVKDMGHKKAYFLTIKQC